jgi:hypothetical protein
VPENLLPRRYLGRPKLGEATPSGKGRTMTGEAVPLNHFDRSKPFYPLVVNYVLQLAGFKEFAVRGFLCQQANAPDGAKDLTFAPAFQTGVGKLGPAIKGQLEKLGGPLELRSDTQGSPVIIDMDDLAGEALFQGGYLSGYLHKVAGWSLLIVAHQISKGRPWHSYDPLWEFLRHSRNAAAHGGTFTFQGDEPRFPAKWGMLEITRDLAGSRVLASAEEPGLLWPGDLVRFLWDIEQTYPAMKA